MRNHVAKRKILVVDNDLPHAGRVVELPQRRRLSDVAEQLLVSVECLNSVIGAEPRAAPEALES